MSKYPSGGCGKLGTRWGPCSAFNRCEWHSTCLPRTWTLSMGLEPQEEVRQAGSMSGKSKWRKGWRDGIQKGGRTRGLDQKKGCDLLSGRVWMLFHGFCSAGWAGGEVWETSEADFGYQTVFNTWRGVSGIALQGRPILQNSLSVWISPSLVFNVYLLAKYNSASHLLINLLPHWAY